MRHFNAFSGTQLIFSRAGPSAAFLWVPFLSPPKEMERKFLKSQPFHCHFCKRPYAEVGIGEDFGGAYAYAVHSCVFGGFHTAFRIFEHHAVFWRNAYEFRTFQEHFGVWLRLGNHISIDYCVEVWFDAEFFNQQWRIFACRAYGGFYFLLFQ